MVRSRRSALLLALLLNVGCSRARPQLAVVAAHGDITEVNVLLRAGADPNECYAPEGVTPFSPLTAAAASGSLPIVDALIKAGAEVDRQCGLQRPMDFAVSNGQVEVVKHLLAAGADPAGRTDGGWTYLMQAVMAVKPSVIPVLLRAGAPLEAQRPDSGETALMMAAAWDIRVVEPLLAAGANVHARSNNGDTPLLAAMKGAAFAAENPRTTPGRFSSRIVEQLLRAGADASDRNRNGETAADLANKTGRFKLEITRILAASKARRGGAA